MYEAKITSLLHEVHCALESHKKHALSGKELSEDEKVTEWVESLDPEFYNQVHLQPIEDVSVVYFDLLTVETVTRKSSSGIART
jgi:hypothetical protein